MSKKRKYLNLPKFVEQNFRNNESSLTGALSEEYSIIKKELVKLLILNSAIFVGVMLLYYFNQQSGFLEKLF